MATATVRTSYLMWVGKEHYPTIDDWAGEAVKLGISKRLPSPAVGQKLMEPGSVIFVAHDEGEYTDCLECAGVIECPEDRKRNEQISRLAAEIKKIKTPFKGDDDFAVFASDSQKRSVKVREANMEKLENENESCELCAGLGTHSGGTGGAITLKDGTAMDYRAFNYWLHQPKKFNPEDVATREMCSTCGGTGKIPCSKIFGMFVPDGIEYILTGAEDEAKLKAMEGFTHLEASVVAKEPKRGCGKRRAGGVYAVASTGKASKDAKKALAELVAKGIIKPEATELVGSFVRFLEPIPVTVKRFRGIKTWGLDPAVESAAEDVLEALS